MDVEENMSSRGQALCNSSPLVAAVALLAVLCGCQRPAAQEAPQPAPPAEENRAGEPRIRLPAVGGMFYPGNPSELREFVENALKTAEIPQLKGRLVGVIAPHAGYQYSGGVAGHAYRALQGGSWDTVVVIGPSHRVPCSGAVLPEADIWRTPLGDVPIDSEVCQALVSAAPGLFRRSDFPHREEHCLEVQVPFLQVVLGDFKLVPILIHDFSRDTCQKAGRILAQVLSSRNAILVASTDLAHYPSIEVCRRVDERTLANVVKMDIDAIYAWEAKATQEYAAENVSCTMCGLGAVVAVITAARGLGADKAIKLKYANSGEVNPLTAERCVGYGAVALCASKASKGQASEEAGATTAGGRSPKSSEPGGGKMASEQQGSPDNLTDEQKKTLLQTARRAISLWVQERKKLTPPDDPVFSHPRAVFVTLRKHGRLRGCIGTLEAVAPLGEAVVDSAISAATRDPRFPPVTSDELDELDIHVSVLSPLKKVDGPDEIQLGKHGIVVRQGFRSGVFLPEVAPEQGWDLPTTLSILCTEKAGLPPDAWKRGAELYVFTTQSFGEEDYGLGPHAKGQH